MTGRSDVSLLSNAVGCELLALDTEEGTELDGKRVWFMVAVVSHEFISVDSTCGFSMGFPCVPTSGGCIHS